MRSNLQGKILTLLIACLLVSPSFQATRYSVKKVADAINAARAKPADVEALIRSKWYDDLDTKTGTCKVKADNLVLNEQCPTQFDAVFAFLKDKAALPAMTLNKALTVRAYRHAKYLAENTHDISHDRGNENEGLFDRYGVYNSSMVLQVAENALAETDPNKDEAYMIASFILDDGVTNRLHRDNIYGEYTQVGVGLAEDTQTKGKVYLVLGFAKPHDCGKCNEITSEMEEEMGWNDNGSSSNPGSGSGSGSGSTSRGGLSSQILLFSFAMALVSLYILTF